MEFFFIISQTRKTNFDHFNFYNPFLFLLSSKKEKISDKAHVVGSLERVWSTSELLSKDQRASLPKETGKIWIFRRCLIDGVMFHSASYRRVVARNDYTAEFTDGTFGTIQTFVKIEEKCLSVRCREQTCSCNLPFHHLVIVETLVEDEKQLPKFRDNVVVKHIKKVKPSKR